MKLMENLFLTRGKCLLMTKHKDDSHQIKSSDQYDTNRYTGLTFSLTSLPDIEATFSAFEQSIVTRQGWS